MWPSDPAGRVNVYDGFYREWGTYLSKQFPKVYRQIAEDYHCYFLCASDYAQPSPRDGVHFTAEGHMSLGKAVADKIKEIIFDKI